MWSIYQKEINSFLNSLIAYLVISVFLISVGLLVWVFPDTSIFDYGYADLGIFFNLTPYVFMFLIPAICMRAMAEERKVGTLELLLTKPISSYQLVGGKLLASISLVVLALIPTLVYYFTLSYISNPVGNVDTAGIAGSYIGLVLLAIAFCSIGLFASAITVNQIIAFILGVFLSFLLYFGFDALASLAFFQENDYGLEAIGMIYHYDGLGKGVVDLRAVAYFLTLSAFFYYASVWTLKIRKWNS